LEWQLALLLIFGSLVVLLLAGLPVAFGFMVVNVIGMYFLWGGEAGLQQLFLSMWDSVRNFALLPFPLFILLGEVLFRSGIANRAIDMVDIWLGRFPGRLALAATGGGIVMSSLSGSGVASAAMLSSTLVPEMEKRGYKTPMSLGPVLGSGGIAMIVPPSGDIVLLASLTAISVGKLLMAGVIPGILMGINYVVYIIVRCYFQPSIAPPYEVAPMPLMKKLKFTGLNILPVAIIIFLVTGVIFLGIATPSEAASMGALGAFVLAAFYRQLNWKLIKDAFLQTGRITVMLLTIVLGAMAFGQILSYTGAVKGLVELATTLPVSPIIVIIVMMVIVLILGCFMDEVAIMLMITPIYMPVVYALGFDPIWFLILFLINMEMGLTTPPFGLILFVVKGVLPPDRKMTDLYKAAAPFLICDAIAITLIIVFPDIALWLPSIMITS
jgi:tripartite ATP-independent transporter DctM subunit